MDGRPTLGIVGAGKVGSTLGRLWYQRGYRVLAVYSRTVSHAHDLAAHVNAVVVESASQVAQAAELTLVTVPDDRIELVAAGLKVKEWAGKAVVHTSGVHGREALSELVAQGAMTGSLHPAFPFADVETAMVTLPGGAFAVEAMDKSLRAWLYGLVRALDGTVLEIPPGQKALYHVALAIASNYTVTLYAVAEQLLMELGAERTVADRALNTLMGATVENLRVQGIPAALTGPLARADVGTIRAHLAALKEVNKTLRDMYIQLARLSFPMLRARGVALENIERLLSQEE